MARETEMTTGSPATAKTSAATDTRLPDGSGRWGGGFFFEACTAEDGASLAWFEGNSGGQATLGADGAGLGASTRGSGGPPGLTGLAVLGVVGELLGMKEALFVGGKNEFASANNALQDSI